MSVLNGYKKYKRYILTSSGYQLLSQWTSSNTVHFDDGNTAQTKVGAINGITDSLTATSSNVALSAKSGKSLQDQITKLNTGLNAICEYNQSNDSQITDSYIYMGKESYNTAGDIFEYNSGGILIKKPGIYAIVGNYHILAAVNDQIELYLELFSVSHRAKVIKNVCMPITMQIKGQIIHIAKIEIETRALLHFKSETAKSYVFADSQTGSNYLTIKKLA